MSLSAEEQNALDTLLAMVRREGPIFDPTLGPLSVDPLVALSRPSHEIRDYILGRGFSEYTAGRIGGALELYYTFSAGGVIPTHPYGDPAKRAR